MLKIVIKKQIKVLVMLVFGAAIVSSARAHFAALKARDWNVLKAVTVGEIREMMKEDEADGCQLTIQDGMRKKALKKNRHVRGRIENGVAHLRRPVSCSPGHMPHAGWEFSWPVRPYSADMRFFNAPMK